MTLDTHNSSAASGGCIAIALVLVGFVLGVGAAVMCVVCCGVE